MAKVVKVEIVESKQRAAIVSSNYPKASANSTDKAASAISSQVQPPLKIRPSKGWVALQLKDVWHYRELLYFLAWRDIKVRYKQTAIGAGWAILQPLVTMMIFTIIFDNFAKIPSDGLPYPIFAYTALLPWNYFAQAIGRCGVSLVGNASLIRKVYFPRLIIPLSAVVAPLVDFAIAFVILLGMMAWFGIAPSWGALALPLLLL